MAKVGSVKALIECKPGSKARFDEPRNIRDKMNVESSMDKSKKNLAMFLSIRDKELTKQDRWNKANVSPCCHLVMTKTGCCPKCGKKIDKAS